LADRERLDEALEELSLQTGVSVVLDQRAVEPSQKKVTARLRNGPLDTAVLVLGTMANLDVEASGTAARCVVAITFATPRSDR
jgi:hypothetical protein